MSRRARPSLRRSAGGVLDRGPYAVLSLLRGGSGSPPFENAGMPREVDFDIDSSSVVEHLLPKQSIALRAAGVASSTLVSRSSRNI